MESARTSGSRRAIYPGNQPDPQILKPQYAFKKLNNEILGP